MKNISFIVICIINFIAGTFNNSALCQIKNEEIEIPGLCVIKATEEGGLND